MSPLSQKLSELRRFLWVKSWWNLKSIKFSNLKISLTFWDLDLFFLMWSQFIFLKAYKKFQGNLPGSRSPGLIGLNKTFDEMISSTSRCHMPHTDTLYNIEEIPPLHEFDIKDQVFLIFILPISVQQILEIIQLLYAQYHWFNTRIWIMWSTNPRWTQIINWKATF